MFDIGAFELLLVAMVALIVIGPKDLPIAMRTAGQWMGKLKAMTRHFRVGLDAMIREAEMEEQEKVWAEKNAQIMREHPPEKVQERSGDPLAKPLPPAKTVEKPGGAKPALDKPMAKPPEKPLDKPAAPAPDAADPSAEPELSLPPPPPRPASPPTDETP